MDQAITVPLIVRGRVIEEDPVAFDGRRGGLVFRTPDVNRHFDCIVQNNPEDIRDLYDLTMDDIFDYLESLGSRLSAKTNPYMRQALEASMVVSGMSPDALSFMYESQTRVLNRPHLKEMVDIWFGDHLERWVTHQRRDRVIKVRAFGSRLVHINPGNSMIIALHSIMNTALLRSDGIIKTPSNDPLTATAIARTMIEMAPDHPITRHITVAYWKGGDTAFEKRLYRPANIDKIVAWGGGASMQHIRAYLGPGIDLIALDPKISCSLIGKAVFASEETMRHGAAMLARDVGFFNQEGCSASRVAYIECGTAEEDRETLNRFGQMVYEELQHLPKEFSSNDHPDFSPTLKDEIAAIRHNPYFKVFGCKSSEGGVIVSQENEGVDFADTLSGRVVNLIPVEKIEDAYSGIDVYTQTVSVYPDSLKDHVRDACAWRGAQRLTSLGCSAGHASMAQPQDGMEPLRRMARWVVIEEFDEDQRGRSGIFFGG